MSEIIKPTKIPQVRQKNVYRVAEEYQHFFTGKKIPVSIKFINQLCLDLVKWAYRDETALTAGSFWLIKSIPFRTGRSWREKYPQLKQAYEDAKQIIGIRREEGSLLRKFDNATFFRTAANYSEDFRDTAVFQSELKAKQEEKGKASITVVLDKFPDSKLVPEKPKDEEKK